MKVAGILIFVLVFINQVNAQKNESPKHTYPDSLNSISEVFVAGNGTELTDTTGLKIACVLEMEYTDSARNEAHPTNSFAVLYDNCSGIYFSIGGIVDYSKIYWLEKADTLHFYPGFIGRQMQLEGIKGKEQIASYLNRNGKPTHIGSKSYGFNCLITESQNYYLPFNNSDLVSTYRFKRKEKISEAQRMHYKQAIKR